MEEIVAEQERDKPKAKNATDDSYSLAQVLEETSERNPATLAMDDKGDGGEESKGKRENKGKVEIVREEKGRRDAYEEEESLAREREGREDQEATQRLEEQQRAREEQEWRSAEEHDKKRPRKVERKSKEQQTQGLAQENSPLPTPEELEEQEQ